MRTGDDVNADHFAFDGFDALRDINRDIWTPFSEAYANNDAAKYISLHSKEFVRASGGNKSSLDLAGYAAQSERSFAWAIDNGSRSGIEFRFFERFASATTASERGVFGGVGHSWHISLRLLREERRGFF